MKAKPKPPEPTSADQSGWAIGRHAILEALSAGAPVEKIYLADNARAELHRTLKASAAGRCPIEIVPRAALDRYTRSAKHQGIAARIAAVAPIALEDWLAGLPKQQPLQALLLDGITDVGNFGAIVRSAAAFGACGVLFAAQHSAPLSPAMVRASAGGAFHVPLVAVKKLIPTVELLKEAGFWIFATAEQASVSLLDVEIPERIVWLIGSESAGISAAMRKAADNIISIPTIKSFASLNAATAAAIVLFANIAAREIDRRGVLHTPAGQA